MAPRNSSPKPCILAIDDDEVLLGFLTAELESQGYRVLTAATPQSAIWLYEVDGGRLYAVLLDFLLPPLSGDFVFDDLQRLNPDVRVVLLTGFDEPVADRMFQRGLRGYLKKPFKLADLTQKVRHVIRAPAASPTAPSAASAQPPDDIPTMLSLL